MIGLAGLGFLGRGIALCLQQHGIHVVALDSRVRVSHSELLTLASSPEDLGPCEFVIESISEDLSAKEALFDELEKHVGATVPIVSNTSAIPISVLQARRKHPGRFAGMHWAPPAEHTRFLEIVRGDQTDDATIQQTVALALELEKEPGIVNKDIPGFVANRLAYALYREALHLLEEGVADLETIDLLCKNSLGLWAPICGPFRWMDITGGPALYASAMERIVPTLSNESGVPATMQELRESNGYFYSRNVESDEEWQAKLNQSARLSRSQIHRSNENPVPENDR
jgi:3-hydroxybutyryl-CoA dehydrogenase